jgi:hypothetical protein
MVFGSALTASTIVPIAVKRATFEPPNQMTAERVRVECAIQDDARLLIAVPVIVSHAAHHAGIAEAIAQEFASEAAEACRHALAGVKNTQHDSSIRLFVDQYQDRVEVVLEYSGGEISLPDSNGSKAAVIDRVHHENTAGRSRLTFTKFCGSSHAKPSH